MSRPSKRSKPSEPYQCVTVGKVEAYAPCYIGFNNSDEETNVLNSLESISAQQVPVDFDSGQCSWERVDRIWHDSRFQQCTRSSRQTLCLQGQFGVGKTWTMLGLLHKLQRRNEVTSDATERTYVARVFFDAGNQHGEATAAENYMYLILLHFVQQIPNAWKLYRDIKTEAQGFHIEIKKISDLIESVLNSVSKTVKSCTLVDGLEECDEDTLGKILEQVSSIQRATGMGIVLTERVSATKWHDWFAEETTSIFPLRPDPNDIRTFLEHQLNRLSKTRKTSDNWPSQKESRDDVIREIQSVSGDNFLLLRLNFDFISTAPSRERLLNDLDTVKSMGRSDDHITGVEYLKKVLTKVYSRSLKRITTTEQPNWQRANLAKEVLGFMRDAIRPLSSHELKELLKIKVTRSGDLRVDTYCPSLTEVTDSCLGLVKLDASGNPYFSHRTLRGYLESNAGHEDIPNSHRLLGERCSVYLTSNFSEEGVCRDKQMLDKRLETFPFLSYSAKYWMHHFMKARNEKTNQQFHRYAIRFLKDKQRVECANQITMIPDRILDAVSRPKPHPGSRLDKVHVTLYRNPNGVDLFSQSGTTGLHQACRFGLHELLPKLLERDLELLEEKPDLNVQDSTGTTPLLLATLHKHAEVAKLLLDRGAKPDTPNICGMTPFMIADSSVLEVLLKKRDDIDVNAKTRRAIGDPEDGFQMANLTLNNEEGVLRQSPIIHGVSTVTGRNALHYACRRGDSEAVTILLEEADLEKDLRDSDGQTAVHKAAKKGHRSCLWLFQEKDPQLLSQTIGCEAGPRTSSDKCGHQYCGGNALHLACAYETSGRTADYLIRVQPDLCHTVDKNMTTPLHLAAAFGGIKLIEQLLSVPGIDINCTDVNGSTPLHFAMANESDHALIELLKLPGSRSLNINAKDKTGMTPLHSAAHAGSGSKVELLVKQNGLDLTLLDNHGVPAHFYAAISGRAKAFNCLWNHKDLERDSQDSEKRNLGQFMDHHEKDHKVHEEVTQSWLSYATSGFSK
ncbi:ankyrin repeat protein [Apiospora arundinis]